MRAIVITGKGAPRSWRSARSRRPNPGRAGAGAGPGVRAEPGRPDAGPGDVPGAAGAPADIPGLEYAGEVDALGPDVTGPLRVGDRVFGIVGGGGQAEFVADPRADGGADPAEPRLRPGGGGPRGVHHGARRLADPGRVSSPAGGC